MRTQPVIDPTEAPPGYYAVLKVDAKPRDGSNICRACDYRADCDQFQHRCSSYAVVTLDGRELQRRDGCNVVFKRNPS